MLFLETASVKKAAMNFSPERLREIMVQANTTLAVAESVTCGHIQAAVGAASGASDFFQGGLTVYALEQKVRHLGVDRIHAEQTNCVSQRVAREMAQGIADLFQTDFGVSSTGYAERSVAQGVESPFAWLAIWRRYSSATGQLVWQAKVEATGLARTAAQAHFADMVLCEISRHVADAVS